jgi:hypothetical protein
MFNRKKKKASKILSPQSKAAAYKVPEEWGSIDVYSKI